VSIWHARYSIFELKVWQPKIPGIVEWKFEVSNILDNKLMGVGNSCSSRETAQQKAEIMANESANNDLRAKHNGQPVEWSSTED
jgi:hypothetical protein